MKKNVMKRFYILLFCVSIFGSSQKVQQVKEGNLALPTSQQPGPLFLYGQNIVDKGDIQAELYLDVHYGVDKVFIDMLPGVLYGVTDRFSLYFNTPFAPRYQVDCCRSSGMEDIFVQAEYALIDHDKPRSTSMLTLVGALYLPTGSAKKNPPTGYGSPSFFIGATASYLSVDWYAIVSPAVWVTTRGEDRKFGNQFFYQAAFGRNLLGDPEGWIVTPMIEFLGIYDWPDTINDTVVPNTGFNVIQVGPALWVSSKRFFGQLGILGMAYQRFRGNQKNNKFLFALDIAWKFNVS